MDGVTETTNRLIGQDLTGRSLYYVNRRRGRGGCSEVDRSEVIKITRPGVRDGDWRGVIEPPRKGFEPDYEFVVFYEQLRDGRYVEADDA